MYYVHYILKGQFLRLTAVLMILLISTHASLIQQRTSESTEPKYCCENKIYLFSEIEMARKAACFGFISLKKRTRRPLVHIEDDKDENLIFEWTIPLSTSKTPEGKRRKVIERITINNSCELIDVLYFDVKKSQFEPCLKIPGVPTFTNSETEEISTEPIVRCGSLSWKQSELQRHSIQHLTVFMDNFVEVKYTSSELDGPWKRNTMKKRVLNEIRGIVVTHNISRRSTTAHNSNSSHDITPNPKPANKKEIISLVCLLDKKIPLFSPTLTSMLSESRKRKYRGEPSS
ncbi:putative effector protein [Blumeria hordei DH14]|uniref:Putative effector protein n=1 Tax=Blumeria graminis f. sp. hordei (strain DH14) TaxID=546991 RepID=N1JNH1_BLUG1|nr:putative effector protein [Blumeria hordei DH14]